MFVICVALTVTGFVLAEIISRRVKAERSQRSAALVPSEIKGLIVQLLEARPAAPEGLFFDRAHTWVELKGSGLTRVGMDGLMERILGKVDEIRLPRLGSRVNRGDELFAVRLGERWAAFASPMDGTVEAINERLAGDPGILRSHPYSSGWICTLKPLHLAPGLRRLLIGDEARAWIKRELARLQDFLVGGVARQPALGPVLQDGGDLSESLVESMDDESWSRFLRNFLLMPR